MSHVTRRLPPQPHLDVPKREARDLLEAARTGLPDALERIRVSHPRARRHSDEKKSPTVVRLSDAQWVVAREYGFASWSELKRRIELNAPAMNLETAIRTGDTGQFSILVQSHPDLLHLPVRSGHWGPPMSFAANIGQLTIVELASSLGARDYQHAFDRALLCGNLECARWLHARGATLPPGVVMGSCETLNAQSLAMLAELGAPFTDAHGNADAPIAMLLETYSRDPAGKHAALQIFSQRGYPFPDTPLMAFHRGDVRRLQNFLEQDPGLLHRLFRYRDIYPPELGCHDDGRSGLHGTPIDGTSLLHLAIDFDEQAIFELLLLMGADVNARAAVDSDGYGGQSPLFHCVVSAAYLCRRQGDAEMTRTLLRRGALPHARASLRKFLDWREKPGWHSAHEVTAVEWGRTFPERQWVNETALNMIAAQHSSDSSKP